MFLRQIYYNVYDYGRRVGSYGKAYRGRYTFKRLGDYGDVKSGNLAAEWDKVRFQILH